MSNKAADLRLTIHPHVQPRPVTKGIPFLGFVIFPTHRLLKRRKAVHYRRRLRGLMGAYRTGELSSDSVSASLLGWINHVRYGDTWGLRRAFLQDVVF